MPLVLLGLAALVVSGTAALVPRSPGRSSLLGAGGAVVGGLLLAASAANVLGGGDALLLKLPWSVPLGSFSLGVDRLSAFFLLPVALLTAIAAVYGAGYLPGTAPGRRLGPHWLWYNLLTAGMVLVLAARNGVLFLVAWEVMSLASFFLVTFEHHGENVRRAGWTYLVATHLGTACLFLFFLVMGRGRPLLDFDSLAAPAGGAGVVFLLSLAGFGTKAGLVPLHVWLPEAHPAAPSHVSAVMSGVMLKTGVYGILRTLDLLGHPATWWGWALMAAGLASALLGVLPALAQKDLKRLLAYSSVENVGIITLGIGIGVVGMAAGLRGTMLLGFGGALLHVWNHALFKSLLFMGAGSVAHGAGTLELDRLGGLLRRMPRTGTAFVAGALAMAALPPLNGFVGEFLVILAAFTGATSPDQSVAVPFLVALTGLALTGGLAAALAAKLFGVVFLGEPRGEGAARAHEAGPLMTVPLVVLAALCLLTGLGAPVVVALQGGFPAGGGSVGWSDPDPGAGVFGPLRAVSIAGTSVLVLTGLLALLRRRLLSRREVRRGPTWDCGYAAPEARMQYTASSFSQPLEDLFHPLTGARRRLTTPRGLFPSEASLAGEAADRWREEVFRPAFDGVHRLMGRFRWLQHGKLPLYVLYIAITLGVLLVWLGSGAR